MLALAILVAGCVGPTEDGSARVARVIDGDTVVLASGERVRYLGIDAPELDHPSDGIECFGREAAERNRELVAGRLVRLQADQTDRDEFGRLLRYVYVNDLFVNAELVRGGYAYSSFRPPDTRHYEELLELELEAEREKRGLWDVCPRARAE